MSGSPALYLAIYYVLASVSPSSADVFVNFTSTTAVGLESTGKALVVLQASGRYSTPITAHVLCYSQLGVNRATPVVDFEPSPRNGLPYHIDFNDVNAEVSFATLEVLIRDDSNKETDDETFTCHILPFQITGVQSACAIVTVAIKDDDILDCPDDKVASFGTSPEPSCSERIPPNSVEVYACHCPQGTYVHRNTCIPVAECPYIEPPREAHQVGVAGVGQVVGDPHYRTFDGLYFDLWDQCYHILARDCEQRSFTVYTRASTLCSGGGARTCVDEVLFEVAELRVRVEMKLGTDGTLQHKFLGPNPHPSDLRVVASDDMITAHSYKLGVTVNFRKWYLTVAVPNTFENKTCGLLGNYNGDPLDDFKLEDGTVVSTAVGDFEKSWRAVFLDETCETLPRIPSQVECDSEETRTQALIFCSVLQIPFQGFSACHSVIPWDRPFQDCMLDRCACGSDSGACGCSVLMNYMERCAQRGVTVGNLPAACVPTCPAGKSFSSCGPKVPPTCADQVGVAGLCTSGCFCSDGEVEDENGGCISPTDCRGVMEPPRLSPPISPSPNSSSCRGVGDPHYFTFDGTVHHFQGQCVYVFVKDCANEEFTVSTFQRAWYNGVGVSYIDLVIISTKGYSKNVILGQDGSITPSILPQDIFDVQTNSLGVTLTILSVGVVVNYDGKHDLKVDVPRRFHGSLCGLCGNHNGQSADDFTVNQLGVEVELNDVNQFGLFWLNRGLLTDFECNLDPGPTPGCLGNEKSKAATFCQYIYTDPSFKSCHGYLDPFEFINVCTYDYCVGLGGSVDEVGMACASIVQYAGRCQEMGVEGLDLPQQCVPTCPDNEVFTPCGPDHQPTCDRPRPLATGCFKKCVCADGLIRHHGDCIPPNTCPIVVNFERSSYAANEGDAGMFLILTAQGFVSREFRVVLVIGKSLLSGRAGAYSGSDSCRAGLHTHSCGRRLCTVVWPPDQQDIRVFVPFSDNRKAEPNRQGLLRLTTQDKTVSFGLRHRATLTLLDDDFNCLGFGESVLYHTEGSSSFLQNAVVKATQPIQSELSVQVQSRDGTANGRNDYQGATLTNFIDSGKENATFFIFVRNDARQERVECFYLSLGGLRSAGTEQPPVKLCYPFQTIVFIEDDDTPQAAPSVDTNGFMCYSNPSRTAVDICGSNGVVALVAVTARQAPTACAHSYQVEVVEAIKGSTVGSSLDILVPPIKGCPPLDVTVKEYYLVAGEDIGSDTVRLGRGGAWWGCGQYESVLADLRQHCRL